MGQIWNCSGIKKIHWNKWKSKHNIPNSWDIDKKVLRGNTIVVKACIKDNWSNINCWVFHLKKLE